MKPIYLASDSKARKKLFKIFGLKFKVMRSGVREESRKKGLSYAALVKRNALRKAEAVALKIKNGIVIGADTIVVQSAKIYGKPKDLGDAVRTLKVFSGKSQYIYTGVAVVDKESGRKSVSYEKTRIHMDSLTEKEIRSYFSYVSPLDKAGSFDIQGKGAFFIRRVEGCFYNVVGLPLRTLYRMLKDAGLKLFLLLFCVFASLGISGCSTEYNIVTGEQESYYYSTEKEVHLGNAMAKEIEKKNKLVDDPLVQNRVEEMGKKIVAVCDRQDIDYTFKVLDEDEVNAVSLPGGHVYIFKGLIDKVNSDDQLAAVIAHEISHIVARHSVKKLQGMQAFNILRILTSQIPSGGAEVGGAADVAFTELILGYGREDELLADQLAARYTKRAGFNPGGMISFLKRLQEIEKRKPPTQKTYFKTHPYVPDRIRVVKEELGEKMNFNDYINIEQEKHE